MQPDTEQVLCIAKRELGSPAPDGDFGMDHPCPGEEEEEEKSSQQREGRLGKAGMAREGWNGDGTLLKKWLWKSHFKRIKEK